MKVARVNIRANTEQIIRMQNKEYKPFFRGVTSKQDNGGTYDDHWNEISKSGNHFMMVSLKVATEKFKIAMMLFVTTKEEKGGTGDLFCYRD